MTVKERVQALREKMKASGVAMYVVPSTDCHESEYVSEHFRARAFITGFTGSAGTAVNIYRSTWKKARSWDLTEESWVHPVP